MGTKISCALSIALFVACGFASDIRPPGAQPGGLVNQVQYKAGVGTFGGLPNSMYPGAAGGQTETSVAVASTDFNDSSAFVGIGGDGFPAYAVILSGGPPSVALLHCQTFDCTASDLNTIATVANIQNYVSLQIGSDGFPRIIYMTATALHYVRCQDVSCATSPVDTSVIAIAGYEMAFYLGAGNVPTIAYVDYNDAAPRPVHVAVCADQDCSAISSTNSLVPTDTFTAYPLAIVAVSGNPAVLVGSGAFANAKTLNLFLCSAADCSASSQVSLDTVASGTTGYYYGNLRLGSDGNLRAMSEIPTSVFVLSICGNASCSSHTSTNLLTGSAGNVAFVSFDLNGLIPQILWESDFGQYTYSVCSNAACATHADTNFTPPTVNGIAFIHPGSNAWGGIVNVDGGSPTLIAFANLAAIPPSALWTLSGTTVSLYPQGTLVDLGPGNMSLNDLTVNGTCTGCGGGTPATPPNSLQFDDAGAFGGSATALLYPTALSTPAAPTVTVVGTVGTSTYGYRVAACTPVGCTPTSTEATVATGNAVLDGTNYNHIVTAAVSGSTSCQVWLTTDTSNFNEGALVATGNCGDAFDDQGSYPLFVNPGTTDRSRGVFLTTNFLMGGHIGIGSGAAVDRFIGSSGFQNAVTVNIVDSVSLDNVIDYGGGAIGINAQLTYTPVGSWNQIWGFNLNPIVGGSGSGSHNFSSIHNNPLYQSVDNLSEFDGIIQDLRFQPSGGSANLNSLLGAYLQQTVVTSGTVGTGYGTYVRNDYTNSVITTLAGGWVLHRCTACAITNNYGYYIQAPVVQSGGTVANSFGFYNEDIGSVTGITNPYYEWFDSTGVFRIKEDNSFDSVGQAIAALYNPQSAKYTPGATDFERLIEGRWNGNVAEIGAEKGGSGTLRDLRLLGANVQVGEPLKLNADLALPFQLTKSTQSAAAPGAGIANLRWVAGTNSGTCKLVGNAGTSATEVTIIDNVGSGC